MNRPQGKIGRPRKKPTPETTARELYLLKIRRERAEKKKKELLISPVKHHNKHNLVWYQKPNDKALVLGWIQPMGEDEIVSKILVDIDAVDSVSPSTLMEEHLRKRSETT